MVIFKVEVVRLVLMVVEIEDVVTVDVVKPVAGASVLEELRYTAVELG